MYYIKSIGPLISTSFLHALVQVAYTMFIAWILSNGERLFGNLVDIVASMALLLLFVISTLITGMILLGKPIMMYLDGIKKEAVMLLFLTVVWLIIFFILAIPVAVLL